MVQKNLTINLTFNGVCCMFVKDKENQRQKTILMNHVKMVLGTVVGATNELKNTLELFFCLF